MYADWICGVFPTLVRTNTDVLVKDGADAGWVGGGGSFPPGFREAGGYKIWRPRR